MGLGLTAIRVLIVEDEALVALDLRMTLEAMGIEVCGAVSSGPEAVAAAEATRPDLVLMDIRLAQGTDGIEAAAEIKRRWDIPVIYTSAHSDPGTIERAMATEPLAFMAKPHSPQSVARTMQAIAAKLRG